MFENVDIKLAASVVASILVIIGFAPYIKDILQKNTQPHLYTWLIVIITQATALVALINGGGGVFGSTVLIIGTSLMALILILSLKYGTKNITKSDTIILFFALLAIIFWWQLDNPSLAVLTVSFIEALSYVPTFRKSYTEPYSETASFWLIMAIAAILVIISLTEYNLLTVTYVLVQTVGNTSLYIMLLWRRKYM
ncbi:MAG: hypothetical protein H6779_01420 [Candidatus Nomurabacteria bacterium]|nr:MAG: hypothetical protein H6779_01420 [Candidatus Nomurabacteria bacterium]